MKFEINENLFFIEGKGYIITTDENKRVTAGDRFFYSPEDDIPIYRYYKGAPIEEEYAKQILGSSFPLEDVPQFSIPEVKESKFESFKKFTTAYTDAIMELLLEINDNSPYKEQEAYQRELYKRTMRKCSDIKHIFYTENDIVKAFNWGSSVGYRDAETTQYYRECALAIPEEEKIDRESELNELIHNLNNPIIKSIEFLSRSVTVGAVSTPGFAKSKRELVKNGSLLTVKNIEY